MNRLRQMVSKLEKVPIFVYRVGSEIIKRHQTPAWKVNQEISHWIQSKDLTVQTKNDPTDKLLGSVYLIEQILSIFSVRSLIDRKETGWYNQRKRAPFPTAQRTERKIKGNLYFETIELTLEKIWKQTTLDPTVLWKNPLGQGFRSTKPSQRILGKHQKRRVKTQSHTPKLRKQLYFSWRT